MSTSKKLMGTTAVGGFTAIEDVFSTYLYTGNGSTQTITNGIDLAGEGGLTWIKSRSAATDHQLFDTERDATKELISNSTAVEATDADTLTAFNSDGFSLGADANTNTSAATYASWTFRKAPRFFDVVTYTGNGVAGRQIAHSLGVAPGCILIKCTNIGYGWVAGHTGAGWGNSGALQSTDAFGVNNTTFNSTSPTDTVFTVGNATGVNQSGQSYVAYLFAHDPLGPSGDGSDGLIACGSFTTDGSHNATVDLGWEPQWVMVKRTDGINAWDIQDSMRGFTAKPTVYSSNPILFANTNDAEITGGANTLQLTSTGFTTDNVTYGTSETYIYIAIRRGPMRQPESGTEVFATVARSGTSTATTVNTGFPVDFILSKGRNPSIGLGENWGVFDRLRGLKFLKSNSTDEELGAPTYQVGISGFDSNTGMPLSASDNDYGFINKSGYDYSTGFVRRAPGFFDVVAYTGTGVARTVTHNLGVAPELMIVKKRSATGNWVVYSGDATDYLTLNSTAATTDLDTVWNDTAPTDASFTLGTNTTVNGASDTYIAYLFATLPGVSKVGSYTGNGTSQTIDCGFTSGARFVLVKATSTTGDWLIADTARGIVAGSDPYLELNTTNAEVTTEDWLDPDSSGFIVNEVAGSNANTSGVSYVFLAIS